MSLFKSASSIDDVASIMEKNLLTIGESSDLTKQLESIAAAADVFDSKGLYKEAEILTNLLEAYAEGDAEKLKKNLLETGTLFARKDYADSSDQLKIDDEDEKSVSDMFDSFEDEH